MEVTDLYNQLKYLRMCCGLSSKEISRLLKKGIYTYDAYEKQSLLLPPYFETRVCKLYDIEKEELYCAVDQLSEKTKEKFHSFKTMSPDEVLKMLIYNYTGQHLDNYTYHEIKGITISFMIHEMPIRLPVFI